MNNLELILNMLAEATTTEINKKENPKGLEENKEIVIYSRDVRKIIKINKYDYIIKVKNVIYL